MALLLIIYKNRKNIIKVIRSNLKLYLKTHINLTEPANPYRIPKSIINCFNYKVRYKKISIFI